MHFRQKILHDTHTFHEDIHNSWLYCFTNPLEIGARVSLSHRQPNVLTLSIKNSSISSYRNTKWKSYIMLSDKHLELEK